MEPLFVNHVRLEKDENMQDEYPFNIEVLKDFDSLSFEKPVSFFIGEDK